MKNKFNQWIAACVIACVSFSNMYAQEKTIFSIETDPSTFIFKGYSLHLRVQPAASERFLIGVGTYAMNMPDMVVDLNKENRDEGWNVRIRSAYAAYGEYYFRKANDRWFVGEQLGIQNFKVTNDTEVIADEARFTNFLAMTYIGYSWHPYKGSFYVKPWAGLGYTKKVDGNTNVGSMNYDVAPIFPFVTFHIGYSF
jgi:hypothetical protein